MSDHVSTRRTLVFWALTALVGFSLGFDVVLAARAAWAGDVATLLCALSAAAVSTWGARRLVRGYRAFVAAADDTDTDTDTDQPSERLGPPQEQIP